MNLENLGQKVLECLAVQKKIISHGKDIAQRNLQIDKSEEESKKRLEEMNKTNTAAREEIGKLTEELADLKRDLQVRLAELSENGVDINLEKSQHHNISL